MAASRRLVFRLFTTKVTRVLTLIEPVLYFSCALKFCDSSGYDFLLSIEYIFEPSWFRIIIIPFFFYLSQRTTNQIIVRPRDFLIFSNIVTSDLLALIPPLINQEMQRLRNFITIVSISVYIYFLFVFIHWLVFGCSQYPKTNELI